MLRTRSKVRVLGRDDLPAVRRVLDQDPVTHVFVDHRVRSTRTSTRAGSAAQLWGYDDGAGVVSLCHAAANLIPVAARLRTHCAAFAAQALDPRAGTRSAILGPRRPGAQAVEPARPTDWGPARDIRARQPFLTLDTRAPLVRAGPSGPPGTPRPVDIALPSLRRDVLRGSWASLRRPVAERKLYRSRVEPADQQGTGLRAHRGRRGHLQGRGGSGHPQRGPDPGRLGQPGPPRTGPERRLRRHRLWRRVPRHGAGGVPVCRRARPCPARRSDARVGSAGAATRFATVLF